jgi:lactoylglutathione lyase
VTTFRTPFPIIYASDADRSVRFYCDAFGFEVTFRWPADGETLEFAFLELGNAGIGIAGTTESLHGLPVAAGAPPAHFELCIYAEDVDAAAERLRALGARELLPPTDQPWQERLCYFVDPDGNPLHITAPIQKPGA